MFSVKGKEKIMKISAILAILMLLCSCYSKNPDGTLNIPQRDLEDIKGNWIGFNENYRLGLRLNVNSDGTGSLLTTLFNEASAPIKVAISINNNMIKVASINKEIDELTFQLEPTLMIMSIDQVSDNMHLKLSLIKEEKFKQKYEAITNL